MSKSEIALQQKGWSPVWALITLTIHTAESLIKDSQPEIDIFGGIYGSGATAIIDGAKMTMQTMDRSANFTMDAFNDFPAIFGWKMSMMV